MPVQGRGLLVLAGFLVLFVALVVGPSLNLAFVGDDYVFLDKTRDATFLSLWSRSNTDFGWYRPWAREFYFWSIQRPLGPDATVFRLVNIALWVIALCLYARIIEHVSGRRSAVLASLGVASAAFWGTPLLWISGSQDLWMLVFAMLSVLLFVSGRERWAAAPFALALLSKETAGVVPLLLVSYLVFIRRARLSRVARAMLPFTAIVLTWLFVHPTLLPRLFGQPASAAELESRPGWMMTLIMAAASCLNLDRQLRPQELSLDVVGRYLAAAVLLAGSAYLLLRRNAGPRTVIDPRRQALLAAAWAAIGWFPLVLPSIGYHAYYGCMGALGVWFGIALALCSRPGFAAVVVFASVLLRGAQAQTPSSDWGDESYFRRAGSTLTAIRSELLRQHPTLGAHSRVYFANIPYHIGLVAGESPALRVWYGDSTLQAGYYSYYRPRAASSREAPDYFFRFDSAAGMVEVRVGQESIPRTETMRRRWEMDHDGLAALFVAKGDYARAAGEFEKLSMLPGRPDAALCASVCRRFLGQDPAADSLVRAAQLLSGAPPDRMVAVLARIEVDFKRARETDSLASSGP